MTRGTIVWVNLGDADPPEIGKTRPAVVVSNSEQKCRARHRVVVPLSSRPPETWPLRLAVPALAKQKRSYAIVAGIHQVDKRRLCGTIGVAPEAFMRELTGAMMAYLGD